MLSVVVPMFNEADNAVPLVDELLRVLGNVHSEFTKFEIVLVDDGSDDATWLQISALVDRHIEVKGIRLARNFGHQHALLAGLEAANGDAVVTMDADLQHPPELIPEMIAKWSEGIDIVHTERLAAPDTPWLKRITSTMFYSVFSILTGVRVNQGSSDFRMLSRAALDSILPFQITFVN